ncbi:hypothetical protein GGI35DRAFT_483347 [Trichoderma velutinum]
MSPQEPVEGTAQEISNSDPPPAENNKDGEESLLYDISEVFCKPNRKTLWPRINSRIRAFMRLNQIEQFGSRSLTRHIDLCDTREEWMNCVLMALESYRSELTGVALWGTRNRSRRIVGILDSHNELEEQMRECIEEVVENAIEDAECRKSHLKKKLKWEQKMINRERAGQEAARRRTGTFRSFFHSSSLPFSSLRKPSIKIEIVLNPDINDGFFFQIGKERIRNIAALDKAKELMQKQQILIALAHSAVVWDPERVLFRERRIQGQLWTHGFKEEHIRKVEGDLWCVHMRWRPEERSKWRPKTIHVTGKFGRQEAERVDWVPLRYNYSEVELDVKIFVYDDLYDEDEWCERGDGQRFDGPRRTGLSRIFRRDPRVEDDGDDI